MAKTLKQYKKELRDISLSDIIRSKIFKSPSKKGYCELYSLFLRKFLQGGAEIANIDEFSMTLVNKENKSIRIWCGNYPYGYGCRFDIGTKHLHHNLYPSWDIILELRKIQLTRKQELINRFIADSLKAY
jgi:hypothetical protein